MNKRVRIQEKFDLVITIYSKKKWTLLIFTMIMSIIWTCSGFLAILSFPAYNQKGYMLLWLCFWLFSDIYLIKIAFWNLLGKEEITVSKETLTIKKIIVLPIYKNIYDVNKIQNLRASGFFSNSSSEYKKAYYGTAGNVINFNYEGGKSGFGILLDEESAKYIVDKIQEYVK